jgi:hypothetical protein
MASSAINPDTLVTLKVNVEGTNRRFKLPLRDLRANSLPDKVRVYDATADPITNEALTGASKISDQLNFIVSRISSSNHLEHRSIQEIVANFCACF